MSGCCMGYSAAYCSANGECNQHSSTPAAPPIPAEAGGEVMDLTKSLLRSIKDTITRNNDLLDDWNAERGIRTERMDMKDELATLRADIEQLRRERDAIRNETLEETAKRGDAWDDPSALRLAAGEMTAQELRTARAVARGIAAAIRNLKEPSDE